MILFSCQLPPSPPGPENAKIDLSLRSFSGKKSTTTITDTVGNIDTIGVVLYCTQYIDSTRIRVFFENDTIYSFLCKANRTNIDTIFYTVTFSKAADFNVIATGYISGQNNSTATAVFHIVNKPLPNRAPVWSQDTVQLSGESGKLLTRELKDLCSDPDGDSLTFSLMSTALAGDTIIGSVFVVTPAITDTGKPLIHVIAKDLSGLADTVTLKLTISRKDTTAPDTVPPEIVLQSPKIDTVIVIDTFVVKILCTDKSGIQSVQGYHDNTSFTMNKSVSTENLWTGTVKGLSSGKYETIKLVVTDSSVSKNKDSVSVRIKYDGDTSKPVITLVSPAKDSVSINSPDYTVKLKCTDTSGILSVNAVMDTSLFSGVRADSGKWTITIRGLTVNIFNPIIVTATDSSLHANKKIIKLYVKYDPTMTDSVGPTIVQKSGPIHGAVIKDSIITITDSITDPSGLDSVYWTLNNGRAGLLTAVAESPNRYRLQDTLTKFRSNRIVVHAIDKSAARNRDSAVVVLDYNLPPQLNDTAVATNRNTAKTWTLRAWSYDNDTLTWSRLTSPSTLSGTITGTLPTVIFTPAQNWSGNDSFYVRVTDGYWSDTAKIKISVVDVAVAPAILTQPASATKNVGQSVTFTVVINSDVNPAPTYQWKKNGVVIPTAITASFSIGSIARADSGNYTVTVINSTGTVTCQPALLNVLYAPIISTQPQSQILYLDQPATFTVIASGNPLPLYQWKKDGVPISNANSPSYTITSSGVADSGVYTVTVMNSVDTISSDTTKFYSVFKSVSSGYSHTLILKTDGRVFGFGANDYGQLGEVDENNLITTNVKTIAAGFRRSFLLKTDGTLWASGYNSNGQLGDGSTSNQTSFVKLMTDVSSVSAGTYHTLILKTDGTLYSCGENSSGQVGDGTTIERHLPVPVVNGVKSIAAGEGHSLVLKTNGDLVTCGRNNYGQLGDNTTKNDSIFKVVLTGVGAIAAGGEHSLAIGIDGNLYAFGNNSDGELGDGTSTPQSAPKLIKTDVFDVACGFAHSLFLLNGGNVVSCGFNTSGQLGDNTTTTKFTPVQIITNVKSLAAGSYNSFFIKVDGTLWVCGSNINGQLVKTGNFSIRVPEQIEFK
jgi:alpha-tubulin suppressor-like RCC1 family protein